MERIPTLIRRWVAGVLMLAFLAPVLNAVEVRVHGIGWVANGRIAASIQEVIFGDDEPEEGEEPEPRVLQQYDVEDALLVLNGELAARGYLNAHIEVVLWAGDDILHQFIWQPGYMNRLANLASVTKFDLNVETKARSFFAEMSFEGLQSMEPDDARAYFYPDNYFIVSRSERAYSPEALNRGIGSLLARLAQLGRPEARVVSQQVEHAATGGPVQIHLEIDEGPLFLWEGVSYEWAAGATPAEEVTFPDARVPEGVYTRDSERDLAVELRNRFLRAGYPDVVVQSVRRQSAEPDGSRSVEVFFRVNPGPRVRVSEVRFEGLRSTSRRFAEARTGIEEGDWLSRLEIDDARSRLGRLGIFDQLNISLEPPEDPESRAVVFSVVEGLQREINLLAGYGSYEMFRVGAEVRFYNILGRAHQASVRLRQSMRSSAGLLSYSVPDLPWILQRGQVRLQGLRRDEVSFRREEAAASIGIEQRLFNNEVSFTIEYTYEILRAIGIVTDEEVGDPRANVGSITYGISWDRRNRVILPTEGFDLRGELEVASPLFASDAHYQRFVAGGSYHFMTNNDAIRFHFGLEHGILARAGAEAEELPFNKRFFPGGENSIRGYQSGEASPRDAQGEVVGAETYTIGHAEVEFAITQSLSLVLFADGLLTGRFLEDYPGNTTLWSAGAGLRYATPLGPLRLEYGHNLNPRPADPSGTLHFSIGFPF